MKQNNIKFREVKEKDLYKIFNLFKKVFSININRKYYDDRYLIRKNYNSFIAIIENKIIGHVGFIKIKSQNQNKFLYSRHSSFIDSSYQRKGVYNELCNYSFKKILRNNVQGIVIWPNKNNLRVKYSNYLIKYFYHNIIYFKDVNKKKIKHLNFKDHKNFTIETKLYEDTKSIYKKNSLSYKKLFCLTKNNFFIYKSNNFFIIYNMQNTQDLININIMSHNLHKKQSAIFFKNFLFFASKKVNRIHIFSKANRNFLTNLLLSYKFKRNTDRIYSTGIIMNKNNKSKLNNTLSFQMGETDNFHVIN